MTKDKLSTVRHDMHWKFSVQRAELCFSIKEFSFILRWANVKSSWGFSPSISVLNSMKSSQETVAPDGSLKQSRWTWSWYLKTLRLLEKRDVAVSSREV